MIYKDIFKGIECIVLENKILKIVALPSIGGKIASIYNKEKDFELLFQNKNNEYIHPKLGDDFDGFDASGFDDAFPTIDISEVSYCGEKIIYPDHGEIWSSSLDYKISDNDVELFVQSSILPYYYKKTISLSNEKLNIVYHIENTGSESFPCIWAMHCLVNCEENMELNFPKATTEVLNVQDSINLGKKNTLHQYPITKDTSSQDYYLNKVCKKSCNNTEKYYVNGEVTEGKCSIYYPIHSIRYCVNFDKDKMPYLGFWVTEGGFRGDYNCAFEPTNGFYDGIEIAKNSEKLFYLSPDKPLDFTISLSLKNTQ
ncbi:DUF5107 domain-containing protein [Clostridium sp. CF011]|uniref:DUF5107 domain-containing protein n=1 Tax=Clostridium sp. CF011 TaxID=2843318 RepID=UPI001C0CAEE2|nr:DUF5107 domain-containing protein [Clostridium sp. CF011]MBU3092153.1 DUF5107 domain-containing protein [Clostridium sp. CF011]WAG71005.1 DUF5107 domain-containing protein [Clostridium sp. CF011]